MGFNKGAKAIEIEEAAAQASRKSSGSRMDRLIIKGDGDSAYLRFHTGAPDWIHVLQHSGVGTKPGPEKAKSWPKQMDAVCRYDKQIIELLGVTDCYVCDKQLIGFGNDFAKAARRVWAIAALREGVKDPATGRLAGLTDVMEEFDILKEDGKASGEKGTRPKLVMVNMPWSNFFAPIAQADTVYDIRTRDFLITRAGTGTDTTYRSVALDPDPAIQPGTPAWAAYDKALADRKTTLDEIVTERAGDEWFARWFDVTKSVEQDGTITDTGVKAVKSAADPVPADDPDSAQNLAELRARLGL